MGIRDTLRTRTQTAKVFESSPNLNTGAVYELRVKALRLSEGKDKQGNAATWFTPEFTIEKMTPTITQAEIDKLPLAKRPNAAGSSAALPLNILKDWASGVMLSFMSTLLKENPAEFGKAFCAVQCEAAKAGQKCDHKESSLIEELTDEASQPCKGLLIIGETYEKGLRDQPLELRTRVKWTHVPGQEHPLGSPKV